MYVTQSTEGRNEAPQQLELFDTGMTLTELAIEGLTNLDADSERAIATSLLAFARYHADKNPGKEQP